MKLRIFIETADNGVVVDGRAVSNSTAQEITELLIVNLQDRVKEYEIKIDELRWKESILKDNLKELRKI